MVGLLVLLLLGSAGPFDWECPNTVTAGEHFSLRVTTTEPGCSGISVNNISVSQNVNRLGSSTFTSISSVTTSQGRQLTQQVVLELIFSASPGGGSTATIGPIQLNLRGVGTYTLDSFTVDVTGSTSGSNSGASAGIQQTSGLHDEDVWLTGILQDTGGTIYPGTRLFLKYYVYSRVDVSDVTYWWEAPELGVITQVETHPDSDWESDFSKHDNVNRSILADVEMSPAAPGSLLAPVFRADITGTGFDPWGKSPKWTIESVPVVLPVYPFPDNPPENWDGTLLDSVSVRIDKLPSPPGQGGELSVRLTCNGPGSIYMEEPPSLTLDGNAILIQADEGSAGNKRWWDFILEPEETGTFVLGPDSVVWLNRRNGTYRTAVIEPCSLSVTSIPWADREIQLDSDGSENSSLSWIIFALSGVLLLTFTLVYSARKKNKRLASVSSSEDIDELITGLENELSVALTGKKQYLGYEELDELLSEENADSFLARRILRFWRDLEQYSSGREVKGKTFKKLKNTAEELLYKLRKDLKSSKE